MKRLLSATVAGLIATFAFAQQEIQLTQFMNNKLYYNPGVAGSSGSICINAAHRTQWQGFENAPSTQNINAEIPIAAILGAISVNITNDKIGYFQDIKFGLGYAYQMNLANGTLGLGLSVDFINKGLSGGEWIPPDQGASDPSLGKFGSSSITPELNFGAYYQSSTFYAGVSSREMLSAKAEIDNNFGSVTGVKLERTYFIMGGYNWNIPNTPGRQHPSRVAKGSPIFSSVDRSNNIERGQRL